MTDFPDSFTLTIIRHAQTHANVDGTFCGTRDLPLTPSGEAMAMRLHLNPLISPASEIWCSPYQRTFQTAEALGRALKVPKISIDRRLSERDFGAWEGWHGNDLSNVSAYRSWKGDPYYRRPPDGETGPEVLQRLLAFIGPALQRCPRLFIVTHKTPARLLVAHLAGASVANFRALPGFHVSSVTRVSGRPGQGITIEGPSITHLPKAWQADPDKLNIHNHMETITHAKAL